MHTWIYSSAWLLLTVGQTGGLFPMVESLVSILFTWISAQKTLSPKCEVSAIICEALVAICEAGHQCNVVEVQVCRSQQNKRNLIYLTISFVVPCCNVQLEISVALFWEQTLPLNQRRVMLKTLTYLKCMQTWTYSSAWLLLTVGQTGGLFPMVVSLVCILFTWISA